MTTAPFCEGIPSSLAFGIPAPVPTVRRGDRHITKRAFEKQTRKSIAPAVKYRCIKRYAFMRRVYIKTVRRLQGNVMCRKVMFRSRTGTGTIWRSRGRGWGEEERSFCNSAENKCSDPAPSHSGAALKNRPRRGGHAVDVGAVNRGRSPLWRRPGGWCIPQRSRRCL